MPETRRSPILSLVAAFAALAVLVAVLYPVARRSLERSLRLGRLDRVRGLAAGASSEDMSAPSPGDLLVGLDPAGAGLASWASVGGCGVGGTGGGGGARWMGRRSGGAPVEYEFMGSISAGEDLTSNSLLLKVTADAPWRLNLGAQVPYISNTRYYEDFVHGDHTTVSGFGDVSLLVSRQFGLEGNTSANLTVGLPTAPYKEDVQGVYVPYDAQLGIGKPTLGVTVEHNLGRDWGPVILGGGYSYSGGENDVENRRADTLQGYCYVGYRTDRFVHSVGASLSYALQKDINAGNVVEDQSTVLLTLQYGLEISVTHRTPMFIALLATLGEQSAANSMSVALGVVASF